MLSLGPILFAAPLALIALIGLPLLWFILRATPPQPKTEELPSLALFEDLDHREETPDQTPWWIILLRLMAVLLGVIGLSQPIWSPPAQENTESQRDVILLIDNGWTSAPDWSARQSAALDLLGSLDRDRGVYVLASGTGDHTDALAERLSPQAASSKVQAMVPVAWLPDYDHLAEEISASELETADTLWVGNRLNNVPLTDLTDTLSSLGQVTVFPIENPRFAVIESVSGTADGPQVSLIRQSGEGIRKVSLAAYDSTGRSLSSVDGEFAQGETRLDLTFRLPEDLQADISSFRILGQASAASVWQWKGIGRIRRVGLLSQSQTLQPLLSDAYYVKKALSPFATIFEGDLDELLSEDLGAIILTDIGQLPEAELTRLQTWVEGGGVLIRFAGPRMAAQSDSLVPVRLRRASRAFDSALSWDTPQTLDSFPEVSPFADLSVPDDLFVRRQVLAQPDPELARRTWARLKDGTPLITASRMGEGRLILFHVTAGPDWSDLPLSGLFVQILQRVTLPVKELRDIGGVTETSLAPRIWLDGFGSVISPAPDAKPIQTDALADLKPSAVYPAGIYEGGAFSLPLNAATGWTPPENLNWPADVTIAAVSEASGKALSGLFLALAVGLLLIDLLVSLILAGKLRLPSRGRFAATLLALTASGITLASLPPESHAQTDSKPPEAALALKFGYIITGDNALDDQASAGLQGLSNVLYQRTTVEPEAPDGLHLASDPLSLYPLILIVMPDQGMTLSDEEKTALQTYLLNGGALLIDTRKGGDLRGNSSSDQRLTDLLDGLDLPALSRAGENHVLTRSFYLLDGFTGRFPDRPIWIESPATKQSSESNGDGISSIFITDADFTAAWAMDERGRALFTVEGGERNREMAYRTGVNLVMYVLTGNYKEDQVHIPSLLERLGENNDPEPAPDNPPSDIRPLGSEDAE